MISYCVYIEDRQVRMILAWEWIGLLWQVMSACSQLSIIPTRMHSSRMRTGRTLTVFRKLEDPPRKFGAGTPPKIWSRHPPKNLEQAPPKFGAGTPPKIWSRHPPKNLEQAPPKIWSRHPPNLEQAPPKIWSRHPPKIWSRHPPPKFGAGPPPKFGAGTPPVDRHTLMKILPWPKLRFGR